MAVASSVVVVLGFSVLMSGATDCTSTAVFWVAIFSTTFTVCVWPKGTETGPIVWSSKPWRLRLDQIRAGFKIGE